MKVTNKVIHVTAYTTPKHKSHVLVTPPDLLTSSEMVLESVALSWINHQYAGVVPAGIFPGTLHFPAPSTWKYLLVTLVKFETLISLPAFYAPWAELKSRCWFSCYGGGLRWGVLTAQWHGIHLLLYFLHVNARENLGSGSSTNACPPCEHSSRSAELIL